MSFGRSAVPVEVVGTVDAGALDEVLEPLEVVAGVVVELAGAVQTPGAAPTGHGAITTVTGDCAGAATAGVGQPAVGGVPGGGVTGVGGVGAGFAVGAGLAVGAELGVGFVVG